MSYGRVNYIYKGYVYDPEVENDPDVSKIYHNVIEQSTGNYAGYIPLSPYLYATQECFQAWIDAGRPTREQINAAMSPNNCSNPSKEDIINYYIEQVLIK